LSFRFAVMVIPPLHLDKAAPIIRQYSIINNYTSYIGISRNFLSFLSILHENLYILLYNTLPKL